jgi:hypothetical protein
VWRRPADKTGTHALRDSTLPVWLARGVNCTVDLGFGFLAFGSSSFGRASGTIHADPVGPMPVNSNSVALSGDDVLDDLLSLVQPDAPFMLEVRHLGGALTQPQGPPSAVGHRGAVLNLFTSAYPGTVPPVAASAQQQVCDIVAAASVGGPLRNFLPTQYPDATACYEPTTAERLAELKTVWDPSDMFRYTPAVTTEK